MDQIFPINEEDIAVPALDEDRLYELERHFEQIWGNKGPRLVTKEEQSTLLLPHDANPTKSKEGKGKGKPLPPRPGSATTSSGGPEQLSAQSGSTSALEPTGIKYVPPPAKTPRDKNRPDSAAKSRPPSAEKPNPAQPSRLPTPNQQPGAKPGTAASTKSTRSSRSGDAAGNLSPKDDLMQKLIHIFRKVHGATLRVHEELSRNLGMNIGEIAVMERKIVERMRVLAPDIANALPPVALLVLHVVCSDTASIRRFTKDDRAKVDNGEQAQGGPGQAGKPLRIHQAGLVEALVQRLREAQTFQTEGAKKTGSWLDLQADPWTEIASGLQRRHVPLLNKWIGVIVIFYASLDVLLDLCNKGNRPASATVGAVASGSLGGVTPLGTSRLTPATGSGTKTGLLGTPMEAALPSNSQSNTSSAASTPSALPLSSTDSALLSVDGVAMLRVPLEGEYSFFVKYPTVAAALQSLQRLAIVASGEVMDLPLLQPLAGTKQVATIVQTPVASRPAGFEEPITVTPPEVELTEAQAREEQIKARCAGWQPNDAQAPGVIRLRLTPSLPPPAPGGPPPPNSAAAIANALLQGAGQVSSRLVNLGCFRPDGQPMYVAELFGLQSTLTDFDPQTLTLKMAVAASQPPPSVVRTQFKSLLSNTLKDAVKASVTLSSIETRLKSQFVPPHHCHAHPKLKFATLCQTCKKILCTQCVKESHLDHQLLPLAALCVDEMAKLEAKKELLLKRKAALTRLLEDVPGGEANLHSVVDRSIDDVAARIEKRRQVLHEDIVERGKLQRSQLQRELDQTSIDRQRLVAFRDEMLDVSTKAGGTGRVTPSPASASVTKTPPTGGIVPPGPLALLTPATKSKRSKQSAMQSIGSPFPFKLHKGMQVRDILNLRLPTRELVQMIQLLTWSMPSIYLTVSLYPAPDLYAPGQNRTLSSLSKPPHPYPRLLQSAKEWESIDAISKKVERQRNQQGKKQVKQR